MFAWSTTLKYIVRKQYICKSRAFVNECMLCMFPACAVTFLVHDYVARGALSQVARAVTVQPRDCTVMSSNAATAKVEVHINLIFLRGAPSSLGQLVPWRPPQWTAELKFHKDQVCFWNSAIVNVPKHDARCLNLLCECRPQLVWKSIHACDSHSFSYYNFRSRLPRACPLVTVREGSNDASLVL